MVEKLLQMLSITCNHKKTSQPFNAAIAKPSSPNHDWEAVGTGPRHYVVCLECGKKFTYDWQMMRIVR